MCAAVALLTSTLLGPTLWDPVASVLRAHGHRVEVVAHAGPAPRSAAEVIEAFAAKLDPAVEWVLVPHSNAGLFAPSVARRRRVLGIVYVDARIADTGVRPMQPLPRLAWLAEKADAAGVLPPWHQWWGDISDHFPSASIQAACEAEMRSLPLSYFEDWADGTGWDTVPSAYLGFGDTYDAELQRAAAAGWPTARITNAMHLHQVVDPKAVATELEGLMGATHAD